MSDLEILFQKLKITTRRLKRMGYFERRDILQRALQECCAEGIYVEVSSWESIHGWAHAFVVNKQLKSGATVQSFCSVNDVVFQADPEEAVRRAIEQINGVFWDRQSIVNICGKVEVA